MLVEALQRRVGWTDDDDDDDGVIEEDCQLGFTGLDRIAEIWGSFLLILHRR